jgi:hypothetical protein
LTFRDFFAFSIPLAFRIDMASHALFAQRVRAVVSEAGKDAFGAL